MAHHDQRPGRTPDALDQRSPDTLLALLRAIQEQDTVPGLIREVASFMRRWSGCEAVGVRLREGEDFPYFETRGFPEAFVAAERFLCARGREGTLLRGTDGQPLLECMCGNILCGRTDPALPFFSPRGSFWSNGTTRLLAGTSAEERQAETRNRCNGAGYESVALVPLRSGGRTLGLLQFNDRAEGRFTAAAIDFLEQIADQVALALAGLMARAELRAAAAAQVQGEARYRSMFENMPAGFARCRMVFEDDAPADFVYLEVNPAFTRLTGLADVAGRRVSEIIPGIRDHSPDLFRTYGRVARTGRPEHLESYVEDLGIWFSLNVYSPAPGEFIALFETITERKQVDLEVREARTRLEAALTEIRQLNAGLEQRVLERTVELQEVNAELEGFAYAVSHDLRTPLRAMAGYSHALIEDLGPRLRDRERRDLDHIIQATVRMSDLIDGILQLSRISRAGLQRQWVDLSAAAGRIREELEAGEPGRAVCWEGQKACVPGATAGCWRSCCATCWAMPGNSARRPVRPGSRSWAGPGRAGSPSPTMGRASTWPMPPSCSNHSSACTGRTSSPAWASVWPPPGGWCSAMAGSSRRTRARAMAPGSPSASPVPTSF